MEMHEHQNHVSKAAKFGALLLSLLGLSIGIAIAVVATLS